MNMIKNGTDRKPLRDMEKYEKLKLKVKSAVENLNKISYNM